MGSAACPCGDVSRGHDAAINTGLLPLGCLLGVGPQAMRLSLKMHTRHLHMVIREHIHVCQTQETQNRDRENLQVVIIVIIILIEVVIAVTIVIISFIVLLFVVLLLLLVHMRVSHCQSPAAMSTPRFVWCKGAFMPVDLILCRSVHTFGDVHVRFSFCPGGLHF